MVSSGNGLRGLDRDDLMMDGVSKIGGSTQSSVVVGGGCQTRGYKDVFHVQSIGRKQYRRL